MPRTWKTEMLYKESFINKKKCRTAMLKEANIEIWIENILLSAH